MKRIAASISHVVLTSGLCLALGRSDALGVVDSSEWISNSGGRFNDPANWIPRMPDADDIAQFSRGPGVEYNVLFPGRPVIQGPAHYVTGEAWIRLNFVHFIGSTQPNLTPSTYTNSVLRIGYPGNPAVLYTTLSRLSAGTSFIGEFGAGEEATINVNAGTFQITGSDPAGFDLTIGNFGNGTMNVTNNSRVDVVGAEGNAVLAANPGVNGTVNLSGPGAVWNNTSDSASAPLVIGERGAATLTIFNGAHVNDFDAVVARRDGSTGSVTVHGPGSSWTNRNTLVVGSVGDGSLLIAGGGQVNDDNSRVGGSSNGRGEVEVVGAGSRWTQAADLAVGGSFCCIIGGQETYAVGILDVLNGARVNTGGNGTITSLGSIATVNGNGSTWTVGGELATAIDGVLNVTGGGSVSSTTGFVGSFRNGTVNVSGAGSTWNIADVLSVARGGTGTVSVLGGGAVTNRLAFLGMRPPVGNTSSAVAVIEGAGSTWTTTELLVVGYESPGEVVVSRGGQLTSGTGHIGFIGPATGSVRVGGAGARWTNTESLYVGVAGTGMLTVTGGGVVEVDDLLSIGPRGLVQGNNGSIAGDVRNGGVVAPGISPSIGHIDFLGTLRVEGNLSQTAAGTFEVHLNSATGFDKLNVTGLATLDGSLDIDVVNNFVPAIGNAFKVLTYGSRVGRFSTLNDNYFGNGIYLRPVYDADSLTLIMSNAIPGDADVDGDVDVTDVGILATFFGQSGAFIDWVNADFNGDDAVGVGDLGLLATNFGRTSLVADDATLALQQALARGDIGNVRAALAAVPEPSATATTGAALLAAVARPWRRRRRPDPARRSVFTIPVRTVR